MKGNSLIIKELDAFNMTEAPVVVIHVKTSVAGSLMVLIGQCVPGILIVVNHGWSGSEHDVG